MEKWELMFQPSSLPKDLSAASQLCCHALRNPNTKPAVVVLDAINQVRVRTCFCPTYNLFSNFLPFPTVIILSLGVVLSDMKSFDLGEWQSNSWEVVTGRSNTYLPSVLQVLVTILVTALVVAA